MNRQRPKAPDLSAILESLLEAEIKFVLVGGLAAVMQGAPVSTMDVDIVHEQSPENIEKLQAFLESVDAIHRRPDDKIIGPSKEDLSSEGHALFKTSLGPLDVLAFIEGQRSYQDLVGHSVKIQFRGFAMHVLDLETIVEIKKASKDAKDLRRMPVLEETLRQKKGSP